MVLLKATARPCLPAEPGPRRGPAASPNTSGYRPVEQHHADRRRTASSSAGPPASSPYEAGRGADRATVRFRRPLAHVDADRRPLRRRTGSRPAPWPLGSCRHRSPRNMNCPCTWLVGHLARLGAAPHIRDTAAFCPNDPLAQLAHAQQLGGLAFSSRPAGMVHADTTSAMSPGPTS